jgi:uncharacterized protein (DUF3820 family)
MGDDGKGTVVPFGKYKGRLVEELLVADPSYLQWLCGQDWFRAKFVSLHQVIINRGAELARAIRPDVREGRQACRVHR